MAASTSGGRKAKGSQSAKLKAAPLSGPLRVPVSTIIGLVMKAMGRNAGSVKERRLFLRELSNLGRPTDGGDSDPTQERILSYAEKEWASRCGAEFADMVLDYLYRHHAAADAEALVDAKHKCLKVLASQREHRYGNMVGTDSARVQLMEQFVGAYAINRRETSTGEPRQELLILQRARTSGKRTYATFITPEVVCRGRWFIVGDTIWCCTSGRRDTYNYDFANIQLARNSQNSRLLGGILTGTSTNSRFPTAIPVLAIRISEVSNETLELGDRGDAGLRDALTRIMRQTADHLTRGGGRIELLENKVLVDPILDPTKLTAQLVAKTQRDVTKLVMKPLVEFCKSTHHEV